VRGRRGLHCRRFQCGPQSAAGAGHDVPYQRPQQQQQQQQQAPAASRRRQSATPGTPLRQDGPAAALARGRPF